MPGKTIRQLKRDKRSKEKQQADFLAWFQEYASVSRAAKRAKVPRCNIYLWMKDEPFKSLYEEACKVAAEALEDEAVRRAYEGNLKPVYQGGERVGTIREYSDTLLIVLLKARLPDRYKDRREHSTPDGKPLEHNVTIKVVRANRNTPKP